MIFNISNTKSDSWDMLFKEVAKPYGKVIDWELPDVRESDSHVSIVNLAKDFYFRLTSMAEAAIAENLDTQVLVIIEPTKDTLSFCYNLIKLLQSENYMVVEPTYETDLEDDKTKVFVQIREY